MRIGPWGVLSAMICAAVAGCGVTPEDAGEGQAVQGITSSSAFVLTVSGEESPISVTTTGVSDTCPEFGQCQFAFIAGSTLTIKPVMNRNTIDCLQFAGWMGACAGQGSTCTVVINSDLTATENGWTRILGCTPK
jgi:hypothetical protein